MILKVTDNGYGRLS